MLGPQQPAPAFVPLKVPLKALPLSVAVPVAEPLHGEPNVTVNTAEPPLIVPETAMPNGLGVDVLNEHPVCVTVTAVEPEKPQELATAAVQLPAMFWQLGAVGLPPPPQPSIRNANIHACFLISSSSLGVCGRPGSSAPFLVRPKAAPPGNRGAGSGAHQGTI